MSVFISNIAHFTVKNSENMVKSRCFEKSLQWRYEEGIQCIMCKNSQFFAILVGTSIYLKYITIHFTNKSSENEVKSGFFKRSLHWRAPTIFKMKEGHKTSCIKY